MEIGQRLLDIYLSGTNLDTSWCKIAILMFSWKRNFLGEDGIGIVVIRR